MSDNEEPEIEGKTVKSRKAYETPRFMTPAERMERDKAYRKEYYRKRAPDMIQRAVTHYNKHKDEILASLKAERDAKKLARLQAMADSNTDILTWYTENQEKILAGEKAMENKLKLTQFIKKCVGAQAPAQIDEPIKELAEIKPDEPVVSP